MRIIPTERKPSQRDAALVAILERLSGQLLQYDTRLEEISKNQIDLSGVMLRSQVRQDTRQDGTDASLEKFSESITRYRSDMLSLVNEQDRISDTIKELSKRQDMIAGAQEQIGRDIAYVLERLKETEKSAHEHNEFAARQGSEIIKAFSDSNRNSVNLHLDTQKRLGDEHQEISKHLTDADHKAVKLHEGTERSLGDDHKEIQRLISDLRQETKRRLLSLDAIEATLQVLMVRTEPPEKKPFIAVRAARSVGRFFRFSLPGFFRKITVRFRR